MLLSSVVLRVKPKHPTTESGMVSARHPPYSTIPLTVYCQYHLASWLTRYSCSVSGNTHAQSGWACVRSWHCSFGQPPNELWPNVQLLSVWQPVIRLNNNWQQSTFLLC